MELVSDDEDPLSLLLMQKLSRVLPKPYPNVMFGLDDPMTQRPKLAVLIAEYTSQHANLETMFGLTFAILMGVEGRVGLAIYESLENRSAQQRAMKATIQAKLRDDQYAIFEALNTVILKPVTKDRDRMAHWCWGLCPTLSNALLLIPPVEKMKLHSASLSPPQAPQWNFDRIFVITGADLKRALDRIHKAINLFGDFMGFFNPQCWPEVRDQLFQKLSSEPLIREVLNRQNRSKEGPQEVLPVSPPLTASE